MSVPANAVGATLTIRLVTRPAPKLGPKPWHVTHHSSNPNDALRRYVRFTTDGTTTTLDSTTFTAKWIAPCAGRLLQVYLRATTNSGSTSVCLHLNDDTTVSSTREIKVNVLANTTASGSFLGKATSFVAGDRVSLSFQPTSTLNNVVMTAVWELER
jgi:hypothetical protein